MFTSVLKGSGLFDGFDDSALEQIAERMTHRSFAAGEILCEQGARGDSMFVIDRGLAEVWVGNARVSRLHRSDVVGEMALISGEPRTATVRAVTYTDTLELHQDQLATLMSDYPELLRNICRLLTRRLAGTTAKQARANQRGQIIGVIVGRIGQPQLGRLQSMIEATSPRTVKVIDQFRRDTDRGAAWDGVALDGLIASLDDVLPEGNDIVLFVDIAEPQLPNLIGQLDRALVIGTHSDLETTATWAKKQCSDVRGVLLFDRSMPTMVREVAGIQLGWLGRATEIDRWLPWIARHVAGTKIGLALSAGGAKGFAHIAVLEALERAGYAIDYLAGTSAGATVSALTALGLDARARHNVLQQIFSVENAELLMRGTKNGTSEGLAAIAKLQDEIVGAATFADLEIPTSVLTADLAAKAPVVLHEGGLGLALRAAISVPGMLPPIEKGAQRLVDGVIVSPLPTDIVRDMGADIVIASNVMNRSVLPAWSHAPEAPPKSQGSSRLKMVVDMFDAIEIQQIDNSVRSAEEADIAVSPLFGPGSWKDFHLGEAFYRAGHSMAETVVSRLSELAKPIPMSVTG